MSVDWRRESRAISLLLCARSWGEKACSKPGRGGGEEHAMARADGGGGEATRAIEGEGGGAAREGIDIGGSPMPGHRCGCGC